MHVFMKKVSDVHGRVMSLTMGSDNWVVLSGLDEIKEFSMKDTATYRPRKNDVLSGQHEHYENTIRGNALISFFFFQICTLLKSR